MPHEGTKMRKLGHVEVLRLAPIILAHCKSVGGGLAQYDEGWDDDAIVVEYGKQHSPKANISVSNVQGLRMEIVGKIRKSADDRSTDAITSLSARVFELERQMQMVLEWATKNPATAPLFMLTPPVPKPNGNGNHAT